MSFVKTMANSCSTSAKKNADAREKGEKEESIQRFDPEFDAVLNKKIILGYNTLIGCFFCEKLGAKRICSACKVAVYCDRNCQRQAWRETHKDACNAFCYERDYGESIIHSMRSVEWMAEEDFMAAALARRELLLSMVSSMFGKKKAIVSVQSSVIEILGTIRLVGSLSFFDIHDEEFRLVHDALIHTVDEATDETRAQINDGSGTISKDARVKAINAWLEFAKHLKEHDISLSGITFGRGMMDFVGDADFVSLLNEIGHPDVLTIPALEYRVAGEMGAAMKALETL